jgi:hypothetical protein
MSGKLRRLLAALADDSPAFRSRSYAPAGRAGRRLLVALADASPAFTRRKNQAAESQDESGRTT